MLKPSKESIFFVLLILLLVGNYYLIGKQIKQKKVLKDLYELKVELLREQNVMLREYFLKTINKEREKEKTAIKINATVTAFNTVEAQTDNTPCIAKFGYICGRDDVVACPRNIPAHTKVKIFDREYECMDWTHIKYNGRFDISFDKDIYQAKQFGSKYTKITIYAK